MRYLTIYRHKSFVGGFSKQKIYIEDPTSTEIKIQGIPCRKIGTLKNGEQQSFEIHDQGLRIHIIADKLSKDYSSDFYEVLPGTENVALSGKCCYNPFNGNAFRFDGVPTEEMKQRRKKATLRGVSVFAFIFIIFFAVGFAAGFNSNAPKEIEFRDMSVTLTDSFKKETDAQASEKYDVAYATNHVVFMALEESFEDAPFLEGLTVDDYADACIFVNKLSDTSKVKHSGDLTYFTYEKDAPLNGDTVNCTYFAFTFKEDDAFWLIQFAVKTNELGQYEDDIFGWANTITFDK